MILGHEAIRDRLRRAVEKRCAAQTYLFVGPESVGKLSVALDFARRLSGDDSLSDCSVIRSERVEEKGKVKEMPISVKMIREATRALGLSGRNGTRTILIVDDAHKMSEGAQNAFLKTLEEPLPGVTIILVTHNEGGVLSTILSRCERVSFSLVSRDVIDTGFPDVPEAIRRLGRPGLCISLREHPDEFAESFRRLDRLQSFHLLSISDRAMLADACVNDISAAERLFSWWMSFLTQELSSDVSTASRRREILKLLHAIAETLRDVRRFPGSVRLTVEQLFFFRESSSTLFSRNMTRSGLAK